MSKVLFAGPWTGEFGWELCSWNPTIRHEAKKYDHVIVETQPGMEYLYEFADEIRINPRKGDYDMYAGHPSKASDVPAGAHHTHPNHFWKRHARAEFREIKKGYQSRNNTNIHPKEWRKFGTEKPEFVADVFCAFRGPKTFKGREFPEKQWRPDRCQKLVNFLKDEGFSVAIYGGPDNEYYDGATDLRGIPLEQLAGHLSQAKLAIGPSSGTLHFASLCGTPHVTWYGRPIVSLDRYMHYWNPFTTPCTFIEEPDPTAALALQAAKLRLDPETEALHNLKRKK